MWFGEIYTNTSSYCTNCIMRNSDVTEKESGKEAIAATTGDIGGGLSTFKLCVFVLFNIIVVSIVNGLYVYSTIELNTSPEIHLLAEIALSMFKLLWNFVVIPATILDSSHVSESRTKIKQYILMYNSIVAPCLVTMLTSPACFQVSLVYNGHYSVYSIFVRTIGFICSPRRNFISLHIRCMSPFFFQ